MTELLFTLGSLISALGNAQSIGVCKEHVALLQTKISFIKDEVTKLEEENTNLKQRISELHKEAAAFAKAEEYSEERGAFFKRRPGGGYHNAVYCPKCHISTSPFPPGAEFNCIQCGWCATFTEGELASVIANIRP